MVVRGQQKSVTINITYQITTRVLPDYIKSSGAYQRLTTKKVAVKIQEFPSTEREKMEVRINPWDQRRNSVPGAPRVDRALADVGVEDKKSTMELANGHRIANSLLIEGRGHVEFLRKRDCLEAASSRERPVRG